MRKRHLGIHVALLEDVRRFEAECDDSPASADLSDFIAASGRAELARDMAAIERASAALRTAEPELESWTNALAQTMQPPRPLWLLIGALWLSTALVTLGVVFAISTLVG